MSSALIRMSAVDMKEAMMMTNQTTVDLSVLTQVLQKRGVWNYTEFEEGLPLGGTLLVRGYKCSACGFFRRKRYGMSNFCEECGARMKEDTK